MRHGYPTDERPVNVATGREMRFSDKNPAALCVLVNAAGEVATVSRPEPPEEMSIPGGNVDPGETAEMAARRELHEELGVRPRGLRHLGDFKSPTDGRRVSVFRARAWSGELTAAEPNTKAAWMSVKDLLAQAQIYGRTVRELKKVGAFDASFRFADLGSQDVHTTDGGAGYRRGPPTAPEDHELDAFWATRMTPTPAPTNAKDRRAARIARAKAKAGGKPKRPSKPGTEARVRIRGEIGKGGYLNVRHLMSQAGPKAVGEPHCFTDAEKAASFADGAAKVWIELAAPGKYEGHPAGPITITASVIGDMLRNFNTDKARNPNRNIPIDFNHASEQDPTSGSIPENGTPAQGWIHELRIDARGHLFGLVEWFDKARGYIKSGEYQGISPAIRFNSKDRVTGIPIGARLSSAGLTNMPFMDLQRIVASWNQDALAAVAESSPGLAVLMGMGGYAHAPGEYMPKIREIFGMSDLEPASKAHEHLENLRTKFDAVDGDPNAMHEGSSIARYCMSLRDLVGAAPGARWDEDIFDVVQELIDAAIREHEMIYHAAGSPDGDVTTNDDADDGDGDTTMASEQTPKEVTTLLSETQGKVTTLTVQVTELQGKVLMSEQALVAKDAAIVAVTAEKDKVAKDLSSLTTKFSLQDAELTAVRKQLADQKVLLDAREAEDIKRDVDDAIRTYSDTKGAKEELRISLMDHRKDSPASFSTMYPKVDLDKQHLQRTIVTTGANNGGGGGNSQREPTVARINEPGKVKFSLDLKRQLIQAIARTTAATFDTVQQRVVAMSDQDLAKAAKQYLGMDVEAA